MLCRPPCSTGAGTPPNPMSSSTALQQEHVIEVGPTLFITPEVQEHTEINQSYEP